jgi:hypothetical protein
MSWFEAKTDKQATFNLMRQLDVRRAVVEFQGGNDEGGVDGITVYRGEQEVEGTIPYSYGVVEKTPEEQLADLLGRPVYDQYSTFAGEFYVTGQVVWNLAEKTVKMTGQESVESWEPIGGDL